MALQHLEIAHCRNIKSARLNFSPHLNIVTGLNASGKTSLLEAIAVLVQGKSFRTPRLNTLVQTGSEEMIITGAYTQAGQRFQVGVARSQRKTRVKLNGQLVTRTTELVGHLPMFVLTPESHELLDAGPKMRRHYLDWGVFHVEQRYLDAWRDYHRVLRQRNQGLRQQASLGSIQAWDKPLSTLANTIDEYRHHYLDQLAPHINHFTSLLLGFEPETRYRPGWDRETGIQAQLLAGLERDRGRGFTGCGPHRADLQITYQGQAAQTILSRGQQKLLICAMTLAQLSVLTQDRVILVDDLPAELDSQKRAVLMDALMGTGVQVFVTATEPSLIDSHPWPEKKMFHVEHGQIQEVI